MFWGGNSISLWKWGIFISEEKDVIFLHNFNNTLETVYSINSAACTMITGMYLYLFCDCVFPHLSFLVSVIFLHFLAIKILLYVFVAWSPLENWIIKLSTVHLNYVGTFSFKNQLRGYDFQKIEKSIKVFLNERDFSSCWIIQRAYGSEAPGPGLTWGLVTVRKMNSYVQSYSQATFTFHFRVWVYLFAMSPHCCTIKAEIKHHCCSEPLLFLKNKLKGKSVRGWRLGGFHI